MDIVNQVLGLVELMELNGSTMFGLTIPGKMFGLSWIVSATFPPLERVILLPWLTMLCIFLEVERKKVRIWEILQPSELRHGDGTLFRIWDSRHPLGLATV